MSYKGQWLVDYFKNYPTFRKYQKGSYAPPLSLIIAVTHNCASRCTMCNFWTKTERNELTLEELETLFKSPLMRNLKTLDLTGGDPMMRKDLAEIILMARRYLPKAHITMGTAALMPKQLDELLAKTHKALDGVFISMDGTEHTHNKIRGRDDSFSLTMASLDVMKKYGYGLNANMTITKDNYLEILKTYNYFHDKGFSFSAKLPQTSDSYFGGNSSMDFAFTTQDLNNIVAQMDQIPNPGIFDYYHRKWILKGERPLPCYAAHASFYIDSLGKVYPCISKPSMGDLRQNSLEEIWSSAQTEALRKAYRTCTDCYNRCTVDTFMIDEPRWVLKMRLEKRWKKLKQLFRSPMA